MGNKRLENLLKSGKVPIKGEIVRKVKHSSVRIENPLLAWYRGPGYFSLARTFRTVWGGAVSNRKLLFGLSRTRNKAGWIEHFNLRDVTNTIHAQVGAARLNMEVLIAEFYND